MQDGAQAEPEPPPAVVGADRLPPSLRPWESPVLATVAYMGLFLLLWPSTGPGVVALAVLPVIVIAWQHGAWAGAGAGASVFPLTILLAALTGSPPRTVGVEWTAAFMAAALLMVGGFVGLSRQHAARLGLRTSTLSREVAVLQAVVDAMDAWAWAVDSKLQIRQANALFRQDLERLLGQPFEMGMVMVDLLPPGERGVWIALYERCARGEEFDLESRISISGRDRHLAIHARPVLGPDGSVELMSVVARDVTARKVVQAQVKQADRVAAVGDFVSSAIHDVNNPLAILQGNLEVLAETLPEGDEEARQMVDDALAGVRRVVQTIDTLRAVTDTTNPRPGRLDPNRCLTQALQLALPHIRPHARTETTLGDVPTITGQEARVIQALAGLLVNAAQAFEEGGVDTNRVEVRSAVDGDDVVLTIRDTGCGIPPALLDWVLEPFHTTRPIGTASGLGLAFARSVVREMGGSLSLESTPGRGTTVTLRLPAADAAPAEGPPSRSPSARILVIDDEAGMAQTIRNMVPRHHVDAVHNAVEGLERLRRAPAYDLILCDVMMPDMNGQEVFKAIAVANPGLERRVVFMTGGAFTHRARRFLEQVPNPRLNKPFTAGDLEARLAALRRGGGDEDPAG